MRHSYRYYTLFKPAYSNCMRLSWRGQILVNAAGGMLAAHMNLRIAAASGTSFLVRRYIRYGIQGVAGLSKFYYLCELIINSIYEYII